MVFKRNSMETVCNIVVNEEYLVEEELVDEFMYLGRML